MPLVINYLDEEARLFWYGLAKPNEGPPPPWPVFREKFLEKYNYSLIINDLREQLKTCYYKNDMDDYILRFRKLTYPIPEEKLSLFERRFLFKDKLPGQMKQELTKLDMEDKEEIEILFKSARDCERNFRPTSRNPRWDNKTNPKYNRTYSHSSYKNSHSYGKPPATSNPQSIASSHVPMDLDTMDLSKITCYKCQRKGHVSKECRSGQKKRDFSKKTGLSVLDLDEPETQLALLDVNYEARRKDLFEKLDQEDDSISYYDQTPYGSKRKYSITSDSDLDVERDVYKRSKIEGYEYTVTPYNSPQTPITSLPTPKNNLQVVERWRELLQDCHFTYSPSTIYQQSPIVDNHKSLRDIINEDEEDMMERSSGLNRHSFDLALTDLVQHDEDDQLGTPLPYYSISCNGLLVKTILDTGAAANYISMNVVDKLLSECVDNRPILKKIQPRTVRLANGEEDRAITSATVKIDIGEMTVTVVCLVLDLPNIDVILGLPWYKLTSPVINFKTNQYIFSTKGKSSTLSPMKKNSLGLNLLEDCESGVD